MTEINNLTIKLKKDGRAIAENFSFTVKRGDRAVIIGEEGNGKSTLLKAICDKSLVSEYCEVSGAVHLDGRAAYLPQMLEKKYNDTPLYEYFADTEYYMHTDVLNDLDLDYNLIMSEQKLGTLSGGEKVKVQLARLMMSEPDILLLDEPTNDLDIDTLRWIESFIKNSRIPILYISHDETLIENTANIIIHMEQLGGKRKCRISQNRCSYGEYLEFRRKSFDHQHMVASKQREDHEKQMEKWRQIYNRVDHEQRVITRQNPGGARLLKKKMHTVLSMGRRFERESENFIDFPEEEAAILSKFDDDIRIPDGKTVLDFSIDRLIIGERVLSENLRLFVKGGAHIGITGKNGIGKSTLLKLLWEELKVKDDITASYMPQNYADMLDFGKTPIEYLSDTYTKSDITKARTYMGSMKFTREEMTDKIGNLSDGQKAKILFLDMVLKRADVLVLDEPTRNFSPLSAPVVRAALKNFGGTIISISHDRKYLREVCDVVYDMTEIGLYPMTYEADLL